MTRTLKEAWELFVSYIIAFFFLLYFIFWFHHMEQRAIAANQKETWDEIWNLGKYTEP